MSSADLFGKLPTELVKQICEVELVHLPEHSISTLSALARTCKRNHAIVTPTLYKHELDRYHAWGLLWAAKHGMVETFDKFIQYGGRAHINSSAFSVADKYKRCPEGIRIYLLPERHEVWDWSDPFETGNPPECIFTPLTIATMFGQDEMVVRLLDSGASIEIPAQSLCSCKCYLTRKQEISHEKQFYAFHGYAYQDPFWTPLHLAACHGHLSTVKLLIARGANANEVNRSNLGASTALHAAAYRNQVPVMDYLLANGVCGPHDTDSGGHPLSFAVLHRWDITGVKRLVEAGADLAVVGASAVRIACETGNFEAALFLIDMMVERGNKATKRALRALLRNGRMIDCVGGEESWEIWNDEFGGDPRNEGYDWEMHHSRLLDRLEELEDNPKRLR